MWLESTTSNIKEIYRLSEVILESFRSELSEEEEIKLAIETYVREVATLREGLLAKVYEMGKWDAQGIYEIESFCINRLRESIAIGMR